MNKEKIKKKIEKLFQEKEQLYYSDIAQELNLDLWVVTKICEELEAEGQIKPVPLEPTHEKPCPYCGELILASIHLVCPWCGQKIQKE